MITEDLNNLASLNVGNLINVLKQRMHGSSNSRNPASIGHDSNKFQQSFYGYAEIGPHSEIVDAGILKDGLKSLRKAYKTANAVEKKPEIQGLAIYINNIAVVFGRFTEYDLAGSSRIGKLAYDFGAFKEKVTDDWKQHNEPNFVRKMSSAKEKEEREYTNGWGAEPVKVLRKYTGEVSSTNQLSILMDTIVRIAKIVGGPVTAKLVRGDQISGQTRNQRDISRRDVQKGVVELSVRLKNYKLSKKPTASNIEEFVKYAFANPGKTVQFAGYTFSCAASSYDKIDPATFIRGGSFTIRYSSENDYSTHGSNTVIITYFFDIQTSTLKPISAEWNENGTKQLGIFDAAGYTKTKMGIRSFDKKEVFERLLKCLKAKDFKQMNTFIDGLIQMGYDWPEFETFRQSALADQE